MDSCRPPPGALLLPLLPLPLRLVVSAICEQPAFTRSCCSTLAPCKHALPLPARDACIFGCHTACLHVLHGLANEDDTQLLTTVFSSPIAETLVMLI